MYYVYILQSKVNSKIIYIGQTKNLVKRLQQHNQGLTFTTRQNSPWRLIYYEAYLTLELVKLREQRLKHYGNALKELKKRIGL